MLPLIKKQIRTVKIPTTSIPIPKLQVSAMAPSTTGTIPELIITEVPMVREVYTLLSARVVILEISTRATGKKRTQKVA